jgi:acetylornithine deacetylase/succinyl-diaminopimelate desuccinylase-like protein
MPRTVNRHVRKGVRVASDLQAVFDYIDAHQEDFIERLRRLCQQPSVAAQSLGMQETAEMVAQSINALGLGHADLLPTGGFPVVYARLEGTGKRILNFYNHYDVQPAEPLDLWDSDPWGAEIRDGRLYARGVADNKGNTIARICALEALKAVHGSLPCTVQCFVEGEEEIGSVHLHNFVEQYPYLIPADGCIWEFGGKDASERLTMSLGLRGICYVEMRCHGANTDLHSSVANGVINPAWRLVWALATIKAPDGRVLIPGFYDEVLPPPPDAVNALEEMPNNEAAFLQRVGLTHFLDNLTGVPLRVRDRFQPSCTISGFLSGYTGAGSKTVLPSTAMCKVDMRLAPGMTPEKTYERLCNHLKDQGFDDIEVELLGPEMPSMSPMDSDIVRVVVETAKELYGHEPVIDPINPGSGPSWLLCDRFNVPMAGAGVGYSESRAHAPNENIRLADFIQGIKHIALILGRFGSLA